MALIPIFQKCTREYLEKQWEIKFPLSEWTSIQFPYEKVQHLDVHVQGEHFQPGDVLEYETNRYDMVYHDVVMNKKISVFLYMNEDSNEIIAIDEAVQDCENKDVVYPVFETPFWDMIVRIVKKQ